MLPHPIIQEEKSTFFEYMRSLPLFYLGSPKYYKLQKHANWKCGGEGNIFISTCRVLLTLQSQSATPSPNK